MKKNSRKILAVFLSASLLSANCPMTAFADDTTTSATEEIGGGYGRR